MGGLLELSQEQVQSLFLYNPETGDLIWRYRQERSPQWNGRYAETIAGAIVTYQGGNTYVLININNRTYLAHRVIWLYLYGYMPKAIDHKDGNGLNNRQDNLREATQSQNLANRDILQRGVERRGNSYRARIKVEGRIIQLGSYPSYEEAQGAYNIAADKYYGEFARCNRV